jgi:hypothetical protein
MACALTSDEGAAGQQLPISKIQAAKNAAGNRQPASERLRERAAIKGGRPRNHVKP